MHRFRPIIVAGAFALGSLGVGAEEAANPRAEKSAEDSIATASKSFELLSKEHPTEERGALEIPTLATPVFNLGASPALEFSKATVMAKPSKNWLVDGAMSKPVGKERYSSSADAGRSRSVTTDLEAADSIGEKGETVLAAGSGVSSRRDQSTAPMGESTPPSSLSEPINPLASYMSGWISTQDRAVLLPQKSPNTTGTAWANSLLNLASAPSVSTAGGSVIENIGLNQPAFKTSPQENPYLNISGVSATGSLPESVSPANLSNFTFAAPKPIDPSARAPIFDSLSQASGKPAARDLAKPDDNSKYFKQLKRF